MVFGNTPDLVSMTVGGLVTLLVLVFQMLVGMRVIKFEGQTHRRVHKWAAWALTFLAAAHGFLGLVLVYG